MNTFVWLFLGILFVGTSVGLASIVYRAASGALRRNPAVGIRINSTLASDDAWVAGHRAAFWPTAFGSGQMAFGGLTLIFGPSRETGSLITLVVTGVMVASMAVAVFVANQAAARVESDGANPLV